jgi:hypothetical protein
VRASGAHERISVKRTTAEQGKACAGDGHEGVQAASMEQVSPDRVLSAYCGRIRNRANLKPAQEIGGNPCAAYSSY